MNVPLRPVGRLTMETMPHPRGGEDVPIFGDWRSACDHIQRHLLTAPECHAWALVAPDLTEVIDLDDDRARWSLSRRATDGLDESLPILYELYCRAVHTASRDASQLGWIAARRSVTIALGIDGILLVIESVLKTAFLPAQADPAVVASVEESGGPRSDSPSARIRGMRSGRAKNGLDPARVPVWQDRRSTWSRARRIYYEVFRPAVQFIRNQYHDGRDVRGRCLNDYGRLKDVLPPMSRLKFDDWQELRDSARQP